MNIPRGIVSISGPCSEVLIRVCQALALSGLRSLETFDIIGCTRSTFSYLKDVDFFCPPMIFTSARLRLLRVILLAILH